MITLVLGGARSGKSEVAERLAADHGRNVTYVATVTAGDDAELQARIDTHRRRRPGTWFTIEVSEGMVLSDVLLTTDGPVLLDALGPWVAGHENFAVDADDLCEALWDRAGDTVVVSEEVGLGVHPSTEAGRQFRDALGEVNQQVAAIADDVVLVVAGRVLRLDRS